MTDLYVSISDVKQFKTCRQRWDFSSPLRMNLVPRTINRHLFLGDGVHQALAAYYAAKPPSAEVLLSTFNSWVLCETDKIPVDLLTDQNIQEIKDAAVLGRGMLQHYAVWAHVHDEFDDVAASEVPFKLGLPFYPNRYVYFVGRADGWVLCRGQYWLLEHKTCATFPDFNALHLDDQCIAYLWGSQVDGRFHKRRPIGTIYTFLLKELPQIPAQLKSGGLSKAASTKTTPEVYEAELERLGLPTLLYGDILSQLREKPNPFFRRAFIRRAPRAMAKFGTTLIATVREMLDPLVPIYPSCTWWDFTRCPYRVPCLLTANGYDPRPVLEQDYKFAESRYRLEDIEPVILLEET